MSLEKFREVVRPYYRALKEARHQEMRQITREYLDAVGYPPTFTSDAVARWAFETGRVTDIDLLTHEVEDALCGYDVAFRKSAKPDFLFLVDPERLIRACEEVVSRPVPTSAAECIAAVEQTYRALTEAPPDFPRLWPAEIIMRVLEAVAQGELRSLAEQEDG